MKVLITGGSGFIGSNLTDRLLARGDKVLVIDNYATGRHDNLKPHPDLSVVEGTVADSKLVERAFDQLKPDCVIHAAASYKDPDNWEEDVRTNALGTAIVVQACERHNVRRLIYFQTSLSYGLHPVEQPITLAHPINPKESSYAITKTAGEHYVELGKLDYISFRLANIYGPRNISGAVPSLYRRLADDKPCFVVDTRRDFIFIDDLVRLVLMAVDGKGSKGVYHIASGRDYAIKDLYDALVKALGITVKHEVDVRPRGKDDAYTILLEPSKTNKDFDWKPVTPLETGVRAAVEYYKKYGLKETYTHIKSYRTASKDKR